jgi:hypothetical protein
LLEYFLEGINSSLKLFAELASMVVTYGMAFPRLPSLILSVTLHEKSPLGIHYLVDLG